MLDRDVKSVISAKALAFSVARLRASSPFTPLVQGKTSC